MPVSAMAVSAGLLVSEPPDGLIAWVVGHSPGAFTPPQQWMHLNLGGFMAPAFPCTGREVLGGRGVSGGCWPWLVPLRGGCLRPSALRGEKDPLPPGARGSPGKCSSLLSSVPGSLLPRLDGDTGAGSLRLRHPLRVRHLQPEDPGRVAGTDRGVRPSPSPGTAEAPSLASPLNWAKIRVYGRSPLVWGLLEPELVL